ncbi:contractile injection system protein, VgrG/Pvc8 family [Glacieibacterium sp.]|uniref:contractile injection system protein, VgrG/Pvc8 family n=1 Tax=Glacieibacterium sp. TaxID=2860237 RepID=UPI003B005F42
MPVSYTQDNRIGRLKTDLGKDKLCLLRMSCVDRLSEGFTIIVDAVSETVQDMHAILGTNVTIEFETPAKLHVDRFFNGNLWEYTELEADEQGYHYRLVLRPETQFMTLNRRSRIVKPTLTVMEVITGLIIGSHSSKCSGVYTASEHCVQYLESDFDFMSRLMEYEGSRWVQSAAPCRRRASP